MQALQQRRRKQLLGLRAEEDVRVLLQLDRDARGPALRGDRSHEGVQLVVEATAEEPAGDPDPDGAPEGAGELVGGGRHPQVQVREAVLHDQDRPERHEPHAGSDQQEDRKACAHGGPGREGQGQPATGREKHRPENRCGPRADPVHDLPQHERADRPAEAQRQHGRADLHGGLTESGLHKERRVGEQGEHREAAQEYGRVAGTEPAHGEKRQRQDRVGGAVLDAAEPVAGDQADQRHRGDVSRAPVVHLSAHEEEQQQADDAGAQAHCPGVIDVGPGLFRAGFDEEEGHPGHRQEPEGHVDEENPAPRQLGNDERPQAGTEHACQPPDDAAEGQGLGAGLGGGDVRQYDVDQREAAARADPLHGAAGDQHLHALGEPCRERPGHKEADRRLVEHPRGQDVSEFAEDGQRHRPGEQVARIHPAEEAQPPELRHYGRHGGRHDQRVQRP